MTAMKAITVSQPYADLIARGEKWVENRTWRLSYTGPLAIHAGRGTQYLTRAELAAYPTGCIVAVVDLVGYATISAVQRNREYGPTQEYFRSRGLDLEAFLAHEHTEGPCCWLLANVRRLEKPIAIPGQQGLWEVPPMVASALSVIPSLTPDS
jgi:hypothetical protein